MLNDYAVCIAMRMRCGEYLYACPETLRSAQGDNNVSC